MLQHSVRVQSSVAMVQTKPKMKLNFFPRCSFGMRWLDGVVEMHGNDNTLSPRTTSQFKSKTANCSERRKKHHSYNMHFCRVNRRIRYKCLCLNVCKEAAKKNDRTKNPGQAQRHTHTKRRLLIADSVHKNRKTALNSATCINRIWSNLSIFMCLWGSQFHAWCASECELAYKRWTWAIDSFESYVCECWCCVFRLRFTGYK